MRKQVVFMLLAVLLCVHHCFSYPTDTEHQLLEDNSFPISTMESLLPLARRGGGDVSKEHMKQYNEKVEQLERCNEEKQDIALKVNGLENETSNLQTKISGLETDKGNLQEKQNELQSEIDRLKAAQESLNTQVVSLSSDKKVLEGQITQKEASLQEKQKKLEIAENELQAEKTAKNDLAAKLAVRDEDYCWLNC